MTSRMEISAQDARRLQLRAQGFLGAEGRRGGVPGMLARLGAVQLDTISVLARSHELVGYARLGAVPRARVEQAYWGQGRTFEYWAHAACVLPVREWPQFAFRRRAYRARGLRWHEVPAEACDKVLAQLAAGGPLTTGDLGGAKKSSEWWDWSDVKIAVEWLLDIGEVVCTSRVGWRRVYDLADRAIPAELREQDPTDEECLTRLVALSGRSLGVATEADLADYYRLKRAQVAAVVAGSGLVAVTVPGWGAAWADPDALATTPRGRHRTTLLSPFDSLVWDRKRSARIFDFDHRLEAYVPKPKRVHGYYTMPVLAGGRLIGRVDPARSGATLVARQISLEPRELSTPTRTATALAAVAEALWEAASWVGCSGVAVERIDPAELHAPLTAAIAETP